MDLLAQALSFIVGVISSWFFWYVLLLTKPKITISPLIAYNPKDNKLRIKIVNRSRRQATDINLALSVAETKDDIQNTTIFRPVLHNPYRQVLNPYHAFNDAWSLPTTTIFRVANARKILKLLSDGAFERRLMLTVSATDAMSGTKIVQRITYTFKDIEKGIFRPGKSFELMDHSSHRKSEDG